MKCLLFSSNTFLIDFWPLMVWTVLTLYDTIVRVKLRWLCIGQCERRAYFLYITFPMGIGSDGCVV